MIIYLLLIFAFNLSFAIEESSQGELSLQGRSFKKDDVPTTEDRSSALVARIQGEVDLSWAQIRYGGLAKTDHYDSGRDLLVVQDLYLEKNWGRFTFLGGYKIFNWSATEAFHPADIINSRNFDADFERPEKIGELTLATNIELENGTLEFNFWPLFARPRFPSVKSRLGIGAAIERPYFQKKGHDPQREMYGTQWGARLTQVHGNIDYSLHYIKVIDRQNPIIDAQFRPIFFYMRQLGGSFQWDLGNGFLLKSEGAIRDYKNEIDQNVIRGNALETRRSRDHSLIVGSLEKQWTFDSGQQLTAIAEYQRLFDVSEVVLRSELNLFENDLLIGLRWALNDEMGQELFTTLIADLERSHEFLWHWQYSRRLNDRWKVLFGLRYIDAPVKGAYPVGLENFHFDHQVFGHLTRYF